MIRFQKDKDSFRVKQFKTESLPFIHKKYNSEDQYFCDKSYNRFQFNLTKTFAWLQRIQFSYTETEFIK